MFAEFNQNITILYNFPVIALQADTHLYVSLLVNDLGKLFLKAKSVLVLLFPEELVRQ